MKDHYDFSKAERGKFYRPDATVRLPVYLDERVQQYLAERAQAKGIELSDLVNELLRKEIDMVEALR